MITPPPPTTARPPPPHLVKDASQPLQDASAADADTGTVNDAARPGDAAPARDGSRDSAPDPLVSPDCSCPPLDFFVDATMGTTQIHLAAPYVLNIYCEETAVTLAHPACGEVYRLSGCNGPNYAPPCLYMGVDMVRGFILGHFIDANGQTWDLLSGSIAPDLPVERAATGTFAATLRPRAGGDVVSMSGIFRGCMPRFPPCAL
jgi:hypothetical protein